MEPLIIRAELRHGYVSSDPWSPSIDGILAYVVMRERLGEEAFVTTAPKTSDLRPVEGLPLEEIRDGDVWWYACSSPAAVGKAAVRQVFFHRRFDDQAERFLPEKTGRVLTAAGPYKSSRLADMHTVCRALEWRAVGDRQDVERLLRSVTSVGGARGRGYGSVVAWDVQVGGDDDARQARLCRPLPAGYAAKMGVDGDVMPWHVVPPARAPGARMECVMPNA
ncbi:hypothetical protein APY04_0807 [Hyphomicrobium sulfonivorans]|uniref:Uncharacterized protein n=1 Tax=Hyphomicrobium sulfonivorans TaxID=121290 RepID=A0A109BKZ6_HYPSL|nr:hypothetical protein [Hyphomicrobium sulfonivorans]KWT70746.1 hypothetical protein APY04_0807 [Hyphomicrobium sulfonivorans]